MKAKYLIVGNGIAGHSAAKAIRSKDKEGSIILIGEEDYPTYFRIRLTKNLAKEFSLEDILLKDKAWYEENKIDLILGAKVVKVKEDEKTLILETGEEVEGEKILFATGSYAFVPPVKGHDLEGVFSIRFYDDVCHLQDYLKDKKKVLVVGGGVLGLEAAASLKALGKEVYIAQRSEYILDKQLDDELGFKLNDIFEAQGFHLLTQKNTQEIKGHDHVEGVLFDDGSFLEMDSVVFSTGVRPRLDLFEGSSFKKDRGLKVNPDMSLDKEGYFAAGDLVEVGGRPLGLWTASMEMGKIAGHNMCADDKETYAQPKLFTKMDLGFVEVFSAGEVEDYDQAYRYDEGDLHAKIFAKEGYLVGAILFGDTSKMNAMKKMVFNKTPIDEAKGAIYPFV
ncbi:MAG: FAD-dependent oxidoreductase [Tissierellia bacterium]|nr:FAD-dependent oxidoreductase [Tissierellia bacterium]